MELRHIMFMAVVFASCCWQECCSLFAETTVLWTQKSLDGYVAIMGIQGDPDDWVKNGVKNTFSSAPLQHRTMQLSHRMAIGFRYADKDVFFSDIRFKEIYKLRFNDVSERPFQYNKTLEVIYDGTSSMVYGIAIDWLANNIYWTDALYNWIQVSPVDKSNVIKRLITTGLDIPFGITLDPYKGILVWTDYGARAKIERSSLDGSQRTAIVTTDIIKPRGITIDIETGTLYWVDDVKNTIEMSDLNGNNRKIMNLEQINGKQYLGLFGIAVFKNYIFITDSFNMQIQVYDKFNMTLLRNESTPLAQAYDILVFDPTLQPTPTPADPNGPPQVTCESLNCSQICQNLGNNQFTCQCGVGYELVAGSQSCKSKMHQMPQFIYTLGNKLCATAPHIYDKLQTMPRADHVYCFHENLTHAEALAFDSYAQYVFYSDTEDNEIVRIRMDLDSEEFIEKEVLAVQTGDVRGMVVDYLVGNLYWADRDFNHIMVSRLDGRYPVILIENASTPCGIEIDARNKTLYWSSESSIKSANLDGTNTKDFMTYKVLQPDGLVLDPMKNRLYWTNTMRVNVRDDGGLSKKNITHVDLRNTSYQLTLSASTRGARWTYRDVAVYQDYMAWTDGKGGIHFVRNLLSPGTTGKKQIDHDDADVSHDVIMYSNYLQPLASGPCDDNNGDCQHLCLPTPSGRTCKCGIGFTLDINQRDCTSDIVEENFMMFSDPYHRQIYQIGLYSTNREPQGVPKDNLQNPQVMEYDQVHRMLYWIENLMDSNTPSYILKRADLQGREYDLRFTLNVDKPIGGLVVWNNKLYYMAGGNIYGVDLSTGTQRVIYTGGNVFPQSLTMDRMYGKLYWAAEGSVQIYSVDLCGSIPQSPQLVTTLATDMLLEGAALSQSPADKMYIWDKTEIVEVNLNDGTYTSIYQDTTAWFSSGGVHNGKLYISQWNKKTVFQLQHDGSLIEYSKPLFSRIVGLKTYGNKDDVATSCSDMPLVTPTTSSPTYTSTTATTQKRTTPTTPTNKVTPTKPSRQPTRPTRPSTTTDDNTASVNDLAPLAAQESKMPVKKVIGLAGACVAAFFIIVVVLVIACFAIRRKKLRKSPAAVHYHPESHDNPTYMTHAEVNNPNASQQEVAGATGVSFDPLPAKPGAESASAVITISENVPVDVSDKAKLVHQQEQNATQPSDITVTFSGNNNDMTASYNNNMYSS